MKRTLLTRGRAIVLAIAVAAGTAGCTVNSPFQTAETMQISDGVPLDLEQVELRNLVLVSDTKGGEATVVGTVDNLTNKPVTLTITAGSSNVKEKIAPNGVHRLSEKKPLTVKGLKAGAGKMTTVQISAGAGDASPVEVPVLPAEGYYEEYKPSEYTPAPTPTKTTEGKGGH